MRKIFKPGDEVPVSGQYIEVDMNGKLASTTEITVVAGRLMPSGTRPGNGYVLINPTKD